ncbi:MAG: aconitate hydratase, partial [Lentisphaeria bacterium]|nr:aconitate hydratase [Lentisphaeria bacterium]
CPMFLGVKAVIAVAIERIHKANLVNFGILPLIFADPADYEKIEQGDSLQIENARQQLGVGKTMEAQLIKKDGTACSIKLTHTLSEDDVRIIMAGGMLNC